MTIYPQDNISVFTTKTGNNITFYNLKEKECPRCLKEFLPKHPRTVYCGSNDCNKIHWAEQYKKNSPTYNKQNKIPKKNCVICHKEFQPYSLSNKGVCSNMDCRYQQRLRWNQQNKKIRGKSHHKKHHMKQYGLTIEEYEQMEDYQNHCCKICGKHESLNGKDRKGNRKRLSIDHDHTTGQVRGLLCSFCNLSLGGFKDNIETLENAIKYLKGSKNSKKYIPSNLSLAKKNIPEKF